MSETQGGLKAVTIYTDGACLGNPGPGGYGAILIYGRHRRELTGGFRSTTNNRMELLGVIAALEALKLRCTVSVHSDSRYVVDAMSQRWPHRWRNNGWRRKDREPVPNTDLWKRLLDLCERHEVRFVWVKGHAGDLENENADRLATQAARHEDLPVDRFYEEQSARPGSPALFGDPDSTAPDRDTGEPDVARCLERPRV